MAEIMEERRWERLLRRAASHQRAGRLARAELAYRDLLAARPSEPRALHGLGLVGMQTGRVELAVATIGMAVRLVPDSAPFHLDLGLALREAGHLEPARAAFHVAALLDPSDATAIAATADMLTRLGRLQEAAETYRRALGVRSDDVELIRALGLVLGALGQDREAVPIWRRAVALAPDDVELRNNLAAVLMDLGEHEAAATELRAALQLVPAHVPLLNNLGRALTDLGRPAEAAAVLQADASRDIEICNNLGVALREMGRLDDALACFDSVTAIDPNHAGAHLNAASVLLMRGAFARGWREFEWRRRLTGVPPAISAAPQWRGEDLAGRTLLVQAEQGLGDTIQFTRFLRLIKGGAVVLQVPQPLVRLLSSLPHLQVLAAADDPPAHDALIPLMSLPRLFDTDFETIPQPPYLAADTEQAARWAQRLEHRPGLRVGICWAGRAAYARDRQRSLRWEQVAPLARLPGVTLISLQRDADPPIVDWTGELHDMAATAALIAALDLVISVDTAIVHLAGALGAPVWLLNRFAGDWRWHDGDPSPWYPSLREFRQSEGGDWDGVLAQVTDALREHAAAMPRRHST